MSYKISRSRDVILPLYSDLVRPPPGVLTPALGSLAQEYHGTFGAGPEKGYRDERAGAPLV